MKRKIRSLIFLSLFSVLFLTFVHHSACAQLINIEEAVILGDFEKAKNLAEGYIREIPSKKESNQALYYLAISQLRLEEYSQARESFRLLLKKTREPLVRDKAYIGIIDSLYLEGEYLQALEESEGLLHRRKDSEMLGLIYLKIASANLKLARWQEADDYLNQIIQKFSGSLEARRAKQLLEEKQFFAVQVGSFLEQKRAVKLIQELKEKGEYAYIVETVDKGGKKFFRVRVGESALLEEAERLKNKLAKQGYPAKIYP